MASTTKVVASRLSSRLQPVGFKFNNKSISPISLPTQLSLTSTTRLSPSLRRLPLQLSCVAASMLPLHSAIASARLVSSLCSDSQTWALVPQVAFFPRETVREKGLIVMSCLPQEVKNWEALESWNYEYLNAFMTVSLAAKFFEEGG